MTCQCGWYRGNLLESRPGAYAPGYFYVIGRSSTFLSHKKSFEKNPITKTIEREEAVWPI